MQKLERESGQKILSNFLLVLFAVLLSCHSVRSDSGNQTTESYNDTNSTPTGPTVVSNVTYENETRTTLPEISTNYSDTNTTHFRSSHSTGFLSTTSEGGIISANESLVSNTSISVTTSLMNVTTAASSSEAIGEHDTSFRFLSNISDLIATTSQYVDEDSNISESVTYFESSATFSTSQSVLTSPLTTPTPIFSGFPPDSLISVQTSPPMMPNAANDMSFGFDEVEIFIPQFAWPYNDTWTRLHPLRISIVELALNSDAYQSVFRIPGRSFAGKAAYFEPSGIRFLRPVEIRLSFNRTISLLSNMTLVTCVFQTSTNTWIPKPSHRSNDRIDFALGFLYADTDSFSMYAPLVVPAPVITLTPVDGGILPGQIALAVVLSIFGAFLILFILYDCHRRSARDADSEAVAYKPQPEEQPKHIGMVPPTFVQDYSPSRPVATAAREVAAAAAPQAEDATATYLGSQAKVAPAEPRRPKTERETAVPPPPEDEPPPPPPPPDDEIEEVESSTRPPPAVAPQHQLSPVSTVDPDTPRLNTQFSHRGSIPENNLAELAPAPAPTPAPAPAPAQPKTINPEEPATPMPVTPPESDDENFELFGAAPATGMATPRGFYEPQSQVPTALVSALRMRARRPFRLRVRLVERPPVTGCGGAANSLAAGDWPELALFPRGSL